MKYPEDFIFNNIFFHPEDMDEYGSPEKCYEKAVENASNNILSFFKRWFKRECFAVGLLPQLFFGLFITFRYLNENKFSKENIEILKKIKLIEIDNTILFLKEYKRIIKNNESKEVLLNELINRKLAGFVDIRILDKEEEWLEKNLSNLKNEEK